MRNAVATFREGVISATYQSNSSPKIYLYVCGVRNIQEFVEGSDLSTAASIKPTVAIIVQIKKAIW